jgi:nucleotide-binding universal stress UspA family protein
MTDSKKIVVGVDGSEGSRRALHWAIDEAKIRGSAIEIVHTWNFSPPLDPVGGFVLIPEKDFQESAQLLVDNLLKSVSEMTSSISISTHVERGSASQILLNRAKTADLLVVGRRGHGGFIELIIGSTAAQVSHHAQCPVVIIPV